MQTVMGNQFSTSQGVDTPRSSFDRSHGYKTTFDAGNLIPFFVDDVLPGDTFNCNVTGFARMATPIYPIMDNLFMDTHFFFVPYRILWDNARKFFGEQENPGDPIDFSIPTRTSHGTSGFIEGSLADYFGIPTKVPDLEVNELYFRAYHLIYDEWFRDQNLQNSITIDKSDTPVTANTGGEIRKRGKRHDYFTSCLPWPQKGDAVTLPLGTTAPVGRLSNAAATNVYTAGTDTQPGINDLYSNAGVVKDGTGAFTFMLDSSSGYYADLTNATAATINDLREAFQIQKLLEHDARGGTRYSEIVKNHFGVTFYDLAYRPEYLGGGSSPVNINPVATTADGTRDVGDLGAMAIAQFRDHGFTKSFNEHGIVIGLVSVRADLTYQKGLNRFFSKKTRYDVYWPSLAHLGEQEVLNKEIYAVGSATPGQDDEVFGYQERYAEYRYKPSSITGQFRSNNTLPLDSWHLSQEFSTLPVLGDTFIKETPPMDRVLQVPSEPDFIFDSYIRLRCARPMPVYGVPGMIDHF